MDNSVKYCLNDKCIVPAVITEIESRSECQTRYDNSYSYVKTPIFTAPMCTVVDHDNYSTWVENGIQAIIPRTVPWLTRCHHMEIGHWVALSQKEFYNYFCGEARVLRGPAQTYYICIDTANAHRKSIYDMVNEAKDYADKEGYQIVVMVGNIANPETYNWICHNSRIDYVRLCIGTGNGCITTTQTGVHYPEASLIEECAKMKGWFNAPKIIADGGMRNNSNILVALALGADYVMCGSLLASMDESCAQWHSDPVTGMKTRLYYGMSTKKAQKLINDAAQHPIPIGDLKLKTSEGTFKYLSPTGSITGWMDNFNSYLASVMSYTDCRTLEEFTSGKVQVITKSPATTEAVNK